MLGLMVHLACSRLYFCMLTCLISLIGKQLVWFYDTQLKIALNVDECYDMNGRIGGNDSGLNVFGNVFATDINQHICLGIKLVGGGVVD